MPIIMPFKINLIILYFFTLNHKNTKFRLI